MKGILFLGVIQAVLFYLFWGNWYVLAIISFGFFYAYKKFAMDYADKLLK